MDKVKRDVYEKCLIGAVLLDNSQIEPIAQTIECLGYCWSLAANASYFNAIVELYKKNGHVDAAEVRDRLVEEDYDSNMATGDMAFILEVTPYRPAVYFLCLLTKQS